MRLKTAKNERTATGVFFLFSSAKFIRGYIQFISYDYGSSNYCYKISILQWIYVFVFSISKTFLNINLYLIYLRFLFTLWKQKQKRYSMPKKKNESNCINAWEAFIKNHTLNHWKSARANIYI